MRRDRVVALLRSHIKRKLRIHALATLFRSSEKGWRFPMPLSAITVERSITHPGFAGFCDRGRNLRMRWIASSERAEPPASAFACQIGVPISRIRLLKRGSEAPFRQSFAGAGPNRHHAPSLEPVG